jgi:pimeloyl-ACP methyl ester carboxylesterase
MGRRSARLGISLFLLLAGCRAAAWREYHHTEPVEYYFTYPATEGPRSPPPLIIALLGEDHSPLDCIELFQPSAAERQMALLCPELGGEGGLADRPRAESDLAAILTDLYAQHAFDSKFTLAGFSDGGEFALEYGLKYPGSVSGISAMSVDEFPEVAAAAMPVQILVGETDERRLAAAQEVEQAWRERGILVRLLTVDGNGREPNRDFARLASEVTEQIP